MALSLFNNNVTISIDVLFDEYIFSNCSKSGALGIAIIINKQFDFFELSQNLYQRITVFKKKILLVLNF